MPVKLIATVLAVKLTISSALELLQSSALVVSLIASFVFSRAASSLKKAATVVTGSKQCRDGGHQDEVVFAGVKRLGGYRDYSSFSIQRAETTIKNAGSPQASIWFIKEFIGQPL